VTLIFGNLVQSFVHFGIILLEENLAAQRLKSNYQSQPLHFVTTPLQMQPYWSISVCQVQHQTRNIFSSLAGVGVFVCTFVYMTIWVRNGEASSKRLRERYLQAVLRQDIAFFDNVSAGEVATRIQTDTRAFCHPNYT
jgi:ATP-binding cassette, subfamily B (MDR/TAP), member 1